MTWRKDLLEQYLERIKAGDMSATAAAVELGCSRRTLQRAMLRHGVHRPVGLRVIAAVKSFERKARITEMGERVARGEITVDAAAYELGCSTRTVYRAVQRAKGTLQPYLKKLVKKYEGYEENSSEKHAKELEDYRQERVQKALESRRKRSKSRQK